MFQKSMEATIASIQINSDFQYLSTVVVSKNEKGEDLCNLLVVSVYVHDVVCIALTRCCLLFKIKCAS